LKTDASNSGMGGVLLQKNVKGELVPIQWSSKKFTPTERRYAISEKEMFAVFWAIKKFEYELRGRRFKLITDHKALEEIRKKPCFNNNRINRWDEKIQDFDFSVEYNKGELLVVPDALSRLHE
jgi:RNase H-like domain found in reverse transcriptase